MIGMNKVFNANSLRVSFEQQIRCLKIISNTMYQNEDKASKAIPIKTMPKSSDLIFNSDNQSNQKAENISKAMTYYLNKMSERGNFIFDFVFFCIKRKKEAAFYIIIIFKV